MCGKLVPKGAKILGNEKESNGKLQRLVNAKGLMPKESEHYNRSLISVQVTNDAII